MGKLSIILSDNLFLTMIIIETISNKLWVDI
jgi:hypothetical protein